MILEVIVCRYYVLSDASVQRPLAHAVAPHIDCEGRYAFADKLLRAWTHGTVIRSHTVAHDYTGETAFAFRQIYHAVELYVS
jgi:hypothetical protein